MRSVAVLVVGGGPGGLVAARCASEEGGGLDVLLVERDRAIGVPVRCAEGVGGPGLREFLEPRGAGWVSREIHRIVFVAPDDTETVLETPEPPYILDRSRFEPVLADAARRAGAELRISTEVTGLRRAGDRWAATVRGPHGDEEIGARVVIGADGVESMVGRWAGLDTRVPSRDMESCAQYVVSNIAFDPDAIYLHFGATIAPHGYAWVFPKGVGVANVGLGIVALHGQGRTARDWLDAYVAQRYPEGAISAGTVGGVIVATTAKRIVADGVMLVGDAAHQVNPLSGGGIITAMKAGRIAGRVAAHAIQDGDTSAARLERYHAEWMALLGEDHRLYYRIKEALNTFDDAFFNALARTVSGIPPTKRSLGRVFAQALVRHPSLLPLAGRLFVEAAL
jgi:digeranylgeranylglycerophospholipid reductase